VDDGICDCCDGSDEPKITCTNVCNEKMVEYWKYLNDEAQNHTEGSRIKRKSAGEAKKYLPVKEQRAKEMKKEHRALLKNLEMATSLQNYPMFVDAKAKLQEFEMEFLPLEMYTFLGKYPGFYDLVGQCFEVISNEKDFKRGSFEPIPLDFAFQFCPFGRISQIEVSPSKKDKPKPTLLGIWDGWHEDSSSEASSQYSHPKMIYTHGDDCYNGPDRKVEVTLECGIQNGISQVHENGKCQYEITFNTPYACNSNVGRELVDQLQLQNAETAHAHDEL